MILNDLGKIADECWCAIPEHFPFVETGAFVIMPNPYGAPPRSLGAMVGSFKSAVTKRFRREHNATGIGQRTYYEHIIHDEKDLKNKTDYIHANPSLGDEDDNNPKNVHNN